MPAAAAAAARIAILDFVFMSSSNHFVLDQDDLNLGGSAKKIILQRASLLQTILDYIL
jgi:hypothetical protein